MGHLFSRAFKRITQLSSSRNSSTSQQPEQPDTTREQDTSQQQHQQQGRPSLHETIPVGQSIDSCEYRALDSNNEQQQTIDTSNQENTAPILVKTNTTTTNNITTATINNNANNNEGNKQDVEEAVIKIQAFVRGHLTRKALKDAHHHSLPAQNALGQCQFDEESLTRNPPSAVFLPSSPLLNYLSNDGDFTTTQQNNIRTSPPVSTTATATTTSSSDQQQQQQQQQHQPSRTPLESIAEVTEIVTSAAQDTGYDSSDNNKLSNNKHDLAAASKLDMPVATDAAPSGAELRSSEGTRESSPSVLLSNLNELVTTSIDLNYDETPASASILISDHNIKPSQDRIASVLHYKEDKQQQQQQQQSGATSNTGEPPRVGISVDEQRSYNNCDLNNGIESQQQQQQQGMLATDSLDSEEAAAIRIQSAFRGYRTRKNSPYRTRSPSSSIDATMKRNGICHQDANILNETILNDHAIAAAAVVSNEEQIEAAGLVGRRESRQRYRDLSPTQQQQQQQGGHIQAATSIEEFTTTEDTTNTVKEATFEMPNQQQRRQTTGLETTTESPRQTIASAAADQSAVLESVKQQLDEPNNNNNNSESSRKADGLSLSFDIAGGLSEEANTLDETGLSAALEAVQETNTDYLIENGAGGGILRDNSLAPRPSEASVELDTDSSVLGAALSLNEDITSATNNDYTQQLQQQQQLQDRPIDDDKSQGVSLITDELEFEARRLVDELNREAAEEDTAASNEERDDRDDNSGAIVEDQDVIDDQEIILNEEEQRVIEMESDDIERRDPRGQASEERAKSPQIRSSEEEPKFNVTTEQLTDETVEEASGETKEKDKTEEEEEEEEEVEIIGSTGAHLEVQSPDDGLTSSGRSSPAINSSPANSSSDSDDNSEAGTSPTTTTTTPTKQQAQAQAQGNSQTRQQQNNQQTGKNKKKNRKRKGKK